jgi:hypothetical protein
MEPTIIETEDRLAGFRQQVKAEDENRTKMSEAAKAKCSCGTSDQAVVWCYLHGYLVKPSPIRRTTVVTPAPTKPVVLMPAVSGPIPEPQTATNEDSESEDHTAIRSGSLPEPVAHVSAGAPSLQSAGMLDGAHKHVEVVPVGATAPTEVENRQSDTDNNSEPVAVPNNFNELQSAKSDEESVDVVQVNPDHNVAPEPDLRLSVSRRDAVQSKRLRRNPWGAYERPVSESVSRPTPVIDVPMPPRAERQTPLRRTVTVPDYVREVKIAEQGGC